MSLSWRPSFVYGSSATLWEASWPMAPPNPVDATIGGRDIAAAGIPAAYRVCQYDLLDVVLRFFEYEWPQVQAFIRDAQESAAPFAFYPDQLDAGHVYNCYLQSPVMGEDVRPRRGEFFGSMELSIQLRSVSGEFDVQIYTAEVS